MNKAIKVILIAFIGIVVIGAIISAGKTKQIVSSTAQQTQVLNGTTPTPAKEKITIKNTTYREIPSYKEILGEATNNDSVVHTMTLKATFYDKSNTIMGTAEGSLNEVSPGETKTFTLLSLDNISGYATYKVQVDSLF